jgi:hypothetical protein
MLVGPLRELAEDAAEVSPAHVWEAIDLYAASRGARLERAQTLEHPAAG